MGGNGSGRRGAQAPLTESCYCSGTPHTAKCRVLRYADRQREGNVRVWDVAEPMARSGDPDTSKQAARSVKNIGEIHDCIMKVLADEGPSTDVDIFGYMHLFFWRPISPSGLRTRRSELVKLGKVVDSGERRTLQSGRLGIVWKLA